MYYYSVLPIMGSCLLFLKENLKHLYKSFHHAELTIWHMICIDFSRCLEKMALHFENNISFPI